MIGILCRSTYLSSFIAERAGMRAAILPEDRTEGGMMPAKNWLVSCLTERNVSVVLYEPRYFIDPSCFRQISPRTRFIVISGPGEEAQAKKAMTCGACAILAKPVDERDLEGVLNLVLG